MYLRVALHSVLLWRDVVLSYRQLIQCIIHVLCPEIGNNGMSWVVIAHAQLTLLCTQRNPCNCYCALDMPITFYRSLLLLLMPGLSVRV